MDAVGYEYMKGVSNCRGLNGKFCYSEKPCENLEEPCAWSRLADQSYARLGSAQTSFAKLLPH